MAEDFRTLLVEVERSEDGERWFDDILVGNIYMSVQAGPFHESDPQEILDPMEYKAFEVTLANKKGVITYGKWGAWDALKDAAWAQRFTPDKTTPSLLNAPFMPVADIQAMYEDLVRYAGNHPV